MTFSKIHTSLLILLGVVVISLGTWWFIKAQVPMPLPISKEDTITSWSFEGPFKDGGTREEETLQKIAGLKSRLGGSEDYQLFVSLAQSYGYVGNGKSAYEYLSRAIAVDTGNTTGIAWHNMGILMEKLGAYYTARIAHERAVEIQPNISAFQVSRVELMIYHFPKDAVGVEKAFTDAEALLGAGDLMLLDLRKRWKALL